MLFLTFHISLWLVALVLLGVGIISYLKGRRDERRDWMAKFGRR